MSDDSRHRESLLTLAVCWGLMTAGGVTQADEEALPDPEFLEYLGSWEESDETWLIFSDEVEETETEDNKDKVDGNDPAPNGEKLAELDDEN